ncbi:MAG: hypothetical protein J6866_04310 [Victivallales bacterium]|nr:hypothetical protein [Victivallales bacterium]
MDTAATFPTGHDGADGAAPSHGGAAFPTGHDGADGAAPSHGGGDLSHGHIGRASSFAKATEDKDARPSLFITNH